MSKEKILNENTNVHHSQPQGLFGKNCNQENETQQFGKLGQCTLSLDLRNNNSWFDN